MTIKMRSISTGELVDVEVFLAERNNGFCVTYNYKRKNNPCSICIGEKTMDAAISKMINYLVGIKHYGYVDNINFVI